jgi:DNA-binding MarR family transcriptional regulator
MHRFSHKVEHKQGCYQEKSKLLQLISQNDGIIQRDLAEEMDVRPSSMTEMLLKMEQLGLIVRKQDEKDQRAMHIYLTDDGKVAVEEAVKATENLTSALFKGLSEEEISQMLEITQKLCASLDMINSQEPDDEHQGHCHGHHHCEEKGDHNHRF